MQQSGYLHESKRQSPTGLALVILAHAGALGALALVKGPQFILPPRGPIVVESIPIPPEPPPEPRPRQPEPRQPQQQQWTAPPPPFERPRLGPDTEIRDLPRLPPTFDNPGPTVVDRPPADPPVPPPVRRDAEYDSRYAHALQPPYPASEERAQRGGTVRVRVTIGANGRVLAVARLAATSEAFWAATQRHALARWRFRPATLDGRPVQSSKILNVRFRIEDL